MQETRHAFRRLVNMRLGISSRREWGLLLVLIAAAGRGLAEDPAGVLVALYENVDARNPFDLTTAVETDSYTEDAFAFATLPVKYSANALPLDRSTPFALRANMTRVFGAGTYEFRLRAKGRARLTIDGKPVLETGPQKPNTSGHDEVPPPAVAERPGLRANPYPHQETRQSVLLTAGEHRFELTAVIGGKGLAPYPGELGVAYGRSNEIPRFLGSRGAPLLTDAAWGQFAADQAERIQALDRMRRSRFQQRANDSWAAYHAEVIRRERLQPKPPVPPPIAGYPALNEVDHFINQRLGKHGVRPTDSLSDLAFLRRLTLDTIGRVPAPHEARTYLALPADRRRAAAIDRLLGDPGWADHWVSYWQDVLAENPGILKPDLNNSGPFRWWLHQSLSDNIPFDRMVAELILMEGSALLGGPAAFAKAALNDAPMAAKADIIVQAFLGEKLSCARCHDAPFHEWKQKDLFAVGAMLEGKPLVLPASSTVPLIEGARKPKVTVALKPGEAILPAWPFAQLVSDTSVTLRPPLDRGPPARRTVAALMVSPDNARFARVLVNRVWKRYVGVGLVEPAEDWYATTPSHPELLGYLAREFVRSGYDLKQLARLILASHVYQRRPVDSLARTAGAAERRFAGPIRRHLSAEQLVDSLHFLTGKPFASEELNLNPAGNRPLTEFLNFGFPRRAWQMTALMNERDRPALALPVAQSIVDVLCAYGWRQARQNPITTREDTPSPMQTLLLANGIMGARVVRLSDDSAFTQLALRARKLPELIDETFWRILARPPDAEETRTAAGLLGPVFADRTVRGAPPPAAVAGSDRRVTWGNHLSAEATTIRMEEERKLRFGDRPTNRLQGEFRERYEDLIWTLINSAEFFLIP